MSPEESPGQRVRPVRQDWAANLATGAAEQGDATDVLTSLPQVQEVVAHGHMLHAMVGEAERESAVADLTAALEAKGVRVDHIEPILPSLEDVFISMIEVERRAQVRAGLQREDA